MSFDISKLIIIDNHAHSIRRNYLEFNELDFRRCFSESRSLAMMEKHVSKSAHYMDLLDNLERTFGIKSEQEFLNFRAKQSAAEYIRLLWHEVSLAGLIVDDGYDRQNNISLAELASASQGNIFHCRRIENVIEKSFVNAGSYAELENELALQLLKQESQKLVALKTICGYRGGLNLLSPSKAEAIAEFKSLKRNNNEAGTFRIQRGNLYHYLLRLSFEIAGENGLPVQIHTGIGDDDADLYQCNPALMQNLFRSQSLAKTNFVLLHCFPYVKEAAFMTALYPNVFMDLSLSISLASPLSAQMITDALSVAPSTKILAGTDGHTCPETHWFGAVCWKRGLGQALLNMVRGSALTYREAEEIAGLILHGNASDLYRLERFTSKTS
ncbi:MAG: amidohydrolase [Candidatus Obscuribacterales bacterium]|nr:amidohydrolase [Candidatus Obscuribacterales bacterium]